MNASMEMLLNAKKALEGQHGGDVESNVASAVGSILRFLLVKAAMEDYVLVCIKLDRAGKMRATEKAALMVERDKLLALMQ